jgi:CRISPR-associated endonuclease Cas2
MSTKNKRQFDYGEITTLIFENIASMLIEAGRYTPPPRLGIILGNIIKLILEKRRKNLSKNKLRKTLSDLEERKVIYIEEKKGKAYVHLLEKGNKKVMEYSLKLLMDFKREKKKWDGKWFLVFFDVPEIERNKRDYLRRYLRLLGFYQYQQSVYLFPYECEKEVALIKKIVEGAKYMRYIIADKIEDETQAKKYFNLGLFGIK